MDDLGVQILIAAIGIGCIVLWIGSRYLPSGHHDDTEQ